MKYLRRPLLCFSLPAACVICFAGFAFFAGSLLAEDTPSLAAQRRKPIAAVVLDGGRLLAVANERSGSVSLVDVVQGSVRGEFSVGKRLASLVALENGKYLLATDEEAGELLVIARSELSLRVVERLPLTLGIASVAVLADGKTVTVAAPWQHKVWLLDLDRAAIRVRVRGVVELPFAGKLQLPLPDGEHVLVADAFGGQLAAVNCATGKVTRTLEFRGHNVGGLALAPDGSEVLLTHQQLNETLPTTRENITRGLLMDNRLRRISVAALVDPKQSWRRSSPPVRLGSIGAGAGDPAGIANISDEQQLIAFAGTNEAAITGPNGLERRLPVGRRPTAIVAIEPGKRYAVLNSLDDSVTLVSYESEWRTKTIPLGPRPPLSSADRGERLFFDARLSADHWLSCHSCHPDGHTNGLKADTRGDQSFGAPKRVLTLRGTALTDKWAWNGDVQDLDVQVKKSLATTIHAASFSGTDVADITTFLHSLPHPPPLMPATASPDDQKKLGFGEKLFGELGCVQCHIPPRTYTSHGVVDVGLKDELGQSKFNPPSLRGVSQNRRFFHDNRAATLEAVFNDFGHQLPRELEREELGALVRFLKSL